jgi:DNA-binding PadR family transcriptional regulator
MRSLTPDETILGLITIHACHGYELIETFRRSEALGDVWKMSTSQIYAVLNRLQRQGFIAGRVVESDTAPNRTEYYLTPAGENRLQAWLHTPQPSASIRRVRVEFLSRLYIAQQLNMPTQPIVACQREACLREQKRLQAELTKAQSGMPVLAIAFVIEQLDAILRWIDRCEMIAASD